MLVTDKKLEILEIYCIMITTKWQVGKIKRSSKEAEEEKQEKEQMVCMNMEEVEGENKVWKTPQRKLNNKPRRIVEEMNEAEEEQIDNKKSIEVTERIESWKTSKRIYEIKPRNIYKSLEVVK